ncbi:MAG: acyltransferase domain-containing protein, partial [Candidatus Binatia bacterium]
IVLQDAALAAPLAAQMALPAHLLTLSAASEAALDELTGSYRQFLAQNPMADLADIATASQKSRSDYSHRAAIVGASAQQMRESLSQDRGAGEVDRRWHGKAVTSANLEIGFLFAGQGTQYVNMGREIYQANPDFRRVLERCDEILRDQLERPLLDVMFGASGELIERTDYAQPALFALEFALAELLQSWGIKPKFVMGHSLGEYVAACVAGVFTLEDGLRLAAARGRLMQQLTGAGKMLAVTAEQTILDALLRSFPAVAIAAINSPSQTVLSGAADAIDRLRATLQAQGTYCRELRVSHGFHSAQMEPVLAPLRQLISKTELRAPRLCLIGNLHGGAVTTEVTDPDYWCQQARQPVQFAAGLRTMVQAGCDLFVEIGPDAIFSVLTQEFSAQQKLDVVPTLRRADNDWAALLATVGRLYVRGVQVDWPAFQKGQNFRSVPLPGYPYQRSRYWYDGALVYAQHRGATAPNHAAGHPLLGRRLRLPGAAEIRFESRFSQSAPQFLNDHRLFGVSLPPAACHIAMLAQAVEFLGGTQGNCYRFEDLYLLRPLLLPDGCERDVQLIFKPDAQGWSLELTSAEVNQAAMASEPWTAHMIGLGRAHLPEKTTPAPPAIDLNAIKARCPEKLSRSEFYSRIWANQGGTGSAFRWIQTIWQGDQEALCRAACPATILDAASYRLHPGLIEAACQVLHCCATIETEEQLRQNSITFVPFSLDALSLYDVKASHDQAWCYAQLREHSENNVLADLSIVNDSGELVAQLDGFRLRPITQQALAASRQRVAAHADGKLISGSLPGPMDGIDKAALTLQQVVRYLQTQCAELSGYSESAIFSDRGFMAMGLDSLVAMILSNRIRQDFDCAVSATQILLSVSIEALAQVICETGSETGLL